MKHFMLLLALFAVAAQTVYCQVSSVPPLSMNASGAGASAKDSAIAQTPAAKIQPSQQDQVSTTDRQQFRFSFQERFRLETTDNASTMSSAANGGSSYSRYRSLLTAQWFPVEELEANVRLGNEFRYYFAPTNKGFTSNEVFFDQLFVRWSTQAFIPATVTLGRQTIAFGEGFIVSEGTPLDGSRTTYYDGARVDIGLSSQKILSVFYTFVPRMDRVLPRINDQAQLLAEGAEEGAGAYFTGDFGATNLQFYGVHKENYTSVDRPVRSHINATGGRLKQPLLGSLMFTGEAAYEFGIYGNEKWTGVGGYAYLDYKTGWSGFLPAVVTMKGVYLSGDNPNTPAREGWEPMWSRFPKYNDLYVYALTKESAIGYWSNYIQIGPAVTFAFSKSVNGTFGFYNLSAPQAPVAGTKFPGGTGKNRGNLFSSRINFTLSDIISGHFVWDRLQPGSFYFKDASVASWMRIELVASI